MTSKIDLVQEKLYYANLDSMEKTWNHNYHPIRRSVGFQGIRRKR